MSTITSPDFKDNARAALGDKQLQRALSEVAPGSGRQARRGARRPAGVRGAARPRPRHQGPHAGAPRPLPGGVRAQGRRRRLHRAFRADGRGRAPDRARHLPGGEGARRHQGQVDDLGGDRPQCRARGRRPGGGRDRSRRVPHPDPRRDAEPHHRARHPPHPGPGRGRLPPPAHEAAGGPAAGRAGAARRRGAADPAREVPCRRRRHHRRQFPDRRDRLLGDRHQRGQRRPHAVAAQGAHRARLHREDGADAGRREHAHPPAGALGNGAGDLDLHHVLHRPPARRRSGRARGLPRRHPRQRPLGAAGHATSARCCAASAAAPA